MGIFRVSCYSKCGSYFAMYLQSVTVIATDKAEALTNVKAWLKKEGRNFIYPEKEWRIDELKNNLESGVIDYNDDSDY